MTKSEELRRLEIGEWLTREKSKRAAGDWLEWLAMSCPEISERTAQRYMLEYHKRSDEYDRLSDPEPVFTQLTGHSTPLTGDVSEHVLEFQR